MNSKSTTKTKTHTFSTKQIFFSYSKIDFTDSELAEFVLACSSIRRIDSARHYDKQLQHVLGLIYSLNVR